MLKVKYNNIFKKTDTLKMQIEKSIVIFFIFPDILDNK